MIAAARSRWLIASLLIAAAAVLGGVVISAEGGWKVVVGLVAIVVIAEVLLALALGKSFRRVFAVIRSATTALVLVAAVSRLGIAADRGASPSWLLAVAAAVAVAAVAVVEAWAWREPRDDLRLAVACLSQALFVAASAIAVIANLEMPN